MRPILRARHSTRTADTAIWLQRPEFQTTIVVCMHNQLQQIGQSRYSIIERTRHQLEGREGLLFALPVAKAAVIYSIYTFRARLRADWTLFINFQKNSQGAAG